MARLKSNFLTILIGFYIISSCDTNNSTTIPDAPTYPFESAQVVNLDTENGYTTNQFTKDSLSPIMTSLGDTVKTGEALKVKGTIIPIDQSQLNITKANQTSEIFNSHINHFKLDTSEMTEIIQSNLITTQFGVSDTSYTLLSSIGDTIISGSAISTQGTLVPSTLPNKTIAAEAIYKDNAIYNIKYLDSDQGLPYPNTIDIEQDKDGNMWIATFGGGIIKYDGSHFYSYTTKNGFSNNDFWGVHQDKKGDMWFSSFGGGVVKYNGKSFTYFTEKNGLANDFIRVMTEDANGNMWFGTNGSGISKYDGESITNYTVKEGLPNNLILSIYGDSKGNVWFGSYNNGVTKFDGETFTTYTQSDGLNSNNILSILEDDNGDMWFGHYGNGICKLSNNKITQYPNINGLSNGVVISMIKDSDNNIWFATFGNGTFMFDDEKFVRYSTKEGLSDDYVRGLKQDKSGNIWMASTSKGISILNPNSFEILRKNEEIIDNTAESFVEDSQHNIWIATINGLIKYNEKSVEYYFVEQGLPSNELRDILIDKNDNIWIATDGNGVIKFDGTNYTNYTTQNGLCNNYVYTLFEDSKNNIWLGTNDGISVFDGENFINYTETDGLKIKSVFDIIEDHNQNIWIGLSGGGACKYDGESFTHFTAKEGLSDNTVWSIYEDKNNVLWFGTNGGGLNSFDGEKFTYLTDVQGLSNNYVKGIIGDKTNHTLWVNTDKGLTYLNLNSDHLNPIIFDKKNGIRSNIFSNNCAYMSHNGTAWWGGVNYIHKLNTKTHQINDSSPTVHLNSLLINQNELDFANLKQNDSLGFTFDSIVPYYNLPQNLVLKYDKNHLTFHFSAINWSSPNTTLYSYILIGDNENWSQPSKDLKADFRNLKHGKYTFKVCAIGANNIWSQPYTYNFTILPPWWLTWWAYLGYILIGFTFIWGLIKWRTNKLKKRQLELENEVEIATLEIREQKEQVVQQKEIIEETHREITDSINYAKRLQDAILPALSEVNNYLKKNFILFKPKDVVSGDFYWFEQIGDWSYIAAADCTGHGVPGAMVSVVCSNALNRSVNEFNITEPSKILDKTRELVIETFAKSGEEVKDGMDIALCAFNGTKVIFAGANNPLWIVRETKLLTEEQKETKSTVIEDDLALIEYKANKQPVGLYAGMKPFEQKEIQLFKNDHLYFFTDGFADQFGGEKGKKFKYKPFKKLLMSLKSKSMTEQQQIIEETFNNWKADLEQIDDVCIIGVSI